MFNQPKSTRNPLVFDRFFLRPNREVLIFGQPRPGDEVIIKGLAKAPELNGKKAATCSVPFYPMVLLISFPVQWLFHWGYSLFSDTGKLGKWMGKWKYGWKYGWNFGWNFGWKYGWTWKSYEIMIPSSFFITQRSPISVSLCHSFVFLCFSTISLV